MRVLVVIAALLLSFGTAKAACTANSVEQAGQAVKQARAQLKAVHIDEMQEDIPPPARVGIERLKDRLQAFVAATLACAPEQVEAKSLSAELRRKGDAYVPGKFQGDGYTMDHFDGDGEGHSLKYGVKVIPSHPDMIGVTATLGVECGDDTMLMLFERRGHDWREVLLRRSPPYKDISGAWMSFNYAVAPRDAQGSWFVATSNIPPWCTSVWRGIRYDLSRPGGSLNKPVVFFDRSEGAYIGNDDVGELKVDTDTFEIRHDIGSIDFDVFTRKAISRFSVAGDTVRRIPPAALNVRDFVDEWIVSSWSEARTWSAPGLAATHARLAAINKGTADNSFGSILRCSNGAVQVELTLAKSGPWFFHVARAQPFQLTAVSEKPSPRCRGPVIAIDKP